MNELELAGLKRKYEATQEPAKKNELRALLVRAGVDPDAAEAKPEPVKTKSETPVGRSTKPLVTAEPSKPAAKAAAKPESKETSKDSEDKPASTTRRPGRPRKTETDK